LFQKKKARGACNIDVVKLLLFNTERDEMEKRKLRQSSGLHAVDTFLGSTPMKLALYPVTATKNLFNAALTAADHAVSVVTGPSMASSATSLSAPRQNTPSVPSEDRRKSWEDFRKVTEDWKKTIEQEMPGDNGTASPASTKPEKAWKPPVDFHSVFYLDTPLLHSTPNYESFSHLPSFIDLLLFL